MVVISTKNETKKFFLGPKVEMEIKRKRDEWMILMLTNSEKRKIKLFRLLGFVSEPTNCCLNAKGLAWLVGSVIVYLHVKLLRTEYFFLLLPKTTLILWIFVLFVHVHASISSASAARYECHLECFRLPNKFSLMESEIFPDQRIFIMVTMT